MAAKAISIIFFIVVGVFGLWGLCPQGRVTNRLSWGAATPNNGYLAYRRGGGYGCKYIHFAGHLRPAPHILCSVLKRNSFDRFGEINERGFYI